MFTEPAATETRLSSADNVATGSDENTNDFLVQMKKRLKSVSDKNIDFNQPETLNSLQSSRNGNNVTNKDSTASVPRIIDAKALKLTFDNKAKLKVTNQMQSKSYTKMSTASPRENTRKSANVEIFPFVDDIQQHHRAPGDVRADTKVGTMTSQVLDATRRREFDAKSLIQEERKKFEEYKR